MDLVRVLGHLRISPCFRLRVLKFGTGHLHISGLEDADGGWVFQEIEDMVSLLSCLLLHPAGNVQMLFPAYCFPLAVGNTPRLSAVLVVVGS